jgi:hypothetical protein
MASIFFIGSASRSGATIRVLRRPPVARGAAGGDGFRTRQATPQSGPRQKTAGAGQAAAFSVGSLRAEAADAAARLSRPVSGLIMQAASGAEVFGVSAG